MTLHYHGTPITPNEVIYTLAGRCFCVSYARPTQVRICHEIGQSVMLDNGAFSAWRQGWETNWPGFYAWCERWMAYPNTWAVIPDVITGGEDVQDALLAEWPAFLPCERSAPVWHMHESLERLRRLSGEWPLVCIGSSAQFATLLTPEWRRRMDEAWNALARGRQFLPRVHMLRGMQLAGMRWPFASLDSTDIARNHPRPQNEAAEMAARWDAMQCPGRWEYQPEQLPMVFA